MKDPNVSLTTEINGIISPLIFSLMKRTKTRRISSEKLRNVLAEFTDNLCALQDRVTLSMSDNTFEIHLEGASIGITFNMHQDSPINSSMKGGVV